jgi:hypothetical protein
MMINHKQQQIILTCPNGRKVAFLQGQESYGKAPLTLEVWLQSENGSWEEPRRMLSLKALVPVLSELLEDT